MSVGWTCQTYADDGLLPSHCPSDKWKKDQICGKTCADAGYVTDPDCKVANTE